MNQDILTEARKALFVLTTPQIGPKRWLLEHPEIVESFVGYMAKYQMEFGYELGWLKPMGNHFELGASFPRLNRHTFIRALNAIFIRLAHSAGYEGGNSGVQKAECQLVSTPEILAQTMAESAFRAFEAGLCESPKKDSFYAAFLRSIDAYSHGQSAVKRMHPKSRWEAIRTRNH